MQVPEIKKRIWPDSGGHRKLSTVCGKFAMVSRQTWQTSWQNLEKFAAENCSS